jgi:hypothetical protein
LSANVKACAQCPSKRAPWCSMRADFVPSITTPPFVAKNLSGLNGSVSPWGPDGKKRFPHRGRGKDTDRSRIGL